MKKVKILIILFIMLLIPKFANALSGKITVSGTNQVILGKNIQITVKLSAGEAWQMDLDYDKSYLQLVSGGGEAGGTNMVNTSTGKPNRTYTFTFKTLKKGTTTVKVGSYYVVADDGSTVNISNSSKSIKIITQQELEASYSKDNNLKSLGVDNYELSPNFNKDTTSYSINVQEGTTKIKINATPNDSKSYVTGTGEVEVSNGINNFNIVVKAENGSEKTYNLVVNVIDQNPIEVTVNNNKYTIVKLRSNFTCKELYIEKDIEINNTNIPACYNEKINYTLIGLKNEDGKIEDYIYENGKYTKYEEVIGTSIKLIPLEYKEEIEGYTKDSIKIDDVNYQTFKSNNNDKLNIIYAMNVLNGKKDFYLYDKDNKTFSLFDLNFLNNISSKNETYLYIIIAFGSALFLSIICIIALNVSKKKLIKNFKLLEKQKESNKLEYTQEDNEIKEIKKKSNKKK